jgi:hypothetical protein
MNGVSPDSVVVEVVPERRLTAVPTPLRRRAIDLATLNDVRREMCRLYRDMRTKRMDPQDGTRMTYVLSQIAKILELGQIQARVESIERAIRSRPQCK